MNWLGELVQKEISPEDSVLDLGCGILFPFDGKRPVCRDYLGVDVFRPYLEKIKQSAPVLWVGLDNVQHFLLDDSFDIVLLLDVVEHFSKTWANHLIGDAKRVARKKIVLYTPVGFMAQGAGGDLNHDKNGAWGLGNTKYQEHKCGFEEKEILDLGFEIVSKHNSRRGACQYAIWKA